VTAFSINANFGVLSGLAEHLDGGHRPWLSKSLVGEKRRLAYA
jgi:hypothetical protein